jgi:hypothetical protein
VRLHRLPRATPEAKADPMPDAKAPRLPQAIHGHYTFRFASPVADPDAPAPPAGRRGWQQRFVVLPGGDKGQIDLAKSIRKMEALQQRASLAFMDADSWNTLGRLCADVYRAMPAPMREVVLAARMTNPTWHTDARVAGIASAPVRVWVEEWSAGLRLMPEDFLQGQIKKLDRPPLLTRIDARQFERHRLLWQARFAAVYQAASLELQQQLEEGAMAQLARLRTSSRPDHQVLKIVLGDRIGVIADLRFAALPLGFDTSTSSDEETPEPVAPATAGAPTSKPADPSPRAPG